MSMNKLPIELVGAVLENISTSSDLLSMRSVNSTCNHLATPHAFHTLHIQNSVQSAQKCQRILADPSLASNVREIVYDRRDNARFCLLPSNARGDCDEMDIAELEEVLTETFCSLAGFTNLESVVLHFWPSFRSTHGQEIHEHPFWFTNRQVTVLHAVHHAMKFSRSIRSLSLNNVVLMSSTSYDFVSSLTNSSLRHFSMSVVSNSELGNWSGSKALNGSLSSLLPVSNSNLISLVLRSPDGLYHSVNTQLRSYNYPALETLVLERIVFDPSSASVDGIEEFIVRHGSSLRRLELRGCASYVPCVTTPVRRWSEIWQRFEEALVSLREIVVVGGGGRGDGKTHQGYALLDGTRGYIPHPSLPGSGNGMAATAARLVEDEKRHLQFRDHVKLRSASMPKKDVYSIRSFNRL